MRYVFILENGGDYPVEKMCKCLKVSKNAYYNWKRKKDIVRSESNKERLGGKVVQIFNDSRQTYGSHRVQQQLERMGLKFSRSYIALIMKEMGLRSVLRKKFVNTTDSNHSFSIAGNELDRDFTSLRLGEKWVSDITYVRVNDDWNYLTTIIDLADRKIVGWSLSGDMTAKNTVCRAWLNAIANRTVVDGFIFHSDRGSQYACNEFTRIFSSHPKMKQSMSRKGNCWDNAVAESFFKTIKHEWLNRFKYTSFFQLKRSIDDYIRWYNTKRLHSSLGYLTPLEREVQLRGYFKIRA